MACEIGTVAEDYRRRVAKAMSSRERVLETLACAIEIIDLENDLDDFNESDLSLALDEPSGGTPPPSSPSAQ